MSTKNTEVIISRIDAESRVRRFLSTKDGGSLLVGGDRGSGKTTLVKTAIESSEKKRLSDKTLIKRAGSYLRLLTKSPYVVVNIPLIIIESSTGTLDQQAGLNERYRSLLMRAMLIGMEADLMRRYRLYQWLDLPQRWFRSIGYLQKIYSLRSYSRYIKQTRTFGASLTGPAGLIANPSLQNAISADIDLSDSSLEMKLRDLLEQYSKLHKFIFVFDELDKLPDSIRLESLVLYMKNLFAETGVHAIFITDEQALKRVMSSADSNPPSELTTLFVDHVLLNNMSREEFQDAIVGRVKNIPEKKLNELLSALTLRTRRSPHELSKLLIRVGTDYDELISQLKSELGSHKFAMFSVMQRLADTVNDLYRPLIRNSYYERMLNTALNEAASIILAGESVYIDQTNTLTLFRTTDLFKQEERTPQEVDDAERQWKSDRTGGDPSTPPISISIHELGEDQVDNIKAAVGTLITLMNRSYIINSTNTDHPDVIKIGAVNKNRLTHEVVDSIKQDVFNLSVTEENILRRIEMFNTAFKRVAGYNLSGREHILKNDSINKIGEDGKYSLSNIESRWSIAKTVARTAESELSNKIIERINKHAVEPVKRIANSRNVSSVTLSNGKKFQLITLFGNQTYRSRSGYDKYFILRDQSARAKMGKVRGEIKNFKMTTDWTNIETVAKQIAEWVNSQ